MNIRHPVLLIFPLLWAGCSSTQGGEAVSFGGALRVEAQIKNGSIVSYSVTHNDTPPLAHRALGVLEERILSAGHPMIDSVTGASYTSAGLKKALVSAQGKDFFGRLRLVFTQDTTRPPDGQSKRRNALMRFFKPRKSLNADIIVVGGGASGMAAAIAAKEQNPSLEVLLVEKLEILGGNAKFTRNLFDIVQSRAQLRAGIKDTAEDLYKDALAQMQRYEIPALPERIGVFARGSAEFDSWLRAHSISLDYLLDTRGIMAGPEAYAGEAIIAGLEKQLKEKGVTVIMGLGVNAIDFGNQSLSAESKKAIYILRGKKIILASGGFAANTNFVVQQDSYYEGFGHSNSPGNTGDILFIASNQNLPLDNMWFITLFNYTLPSGELTGDAEDGTEYILANAEGARFIDEFGKEDIAEAIKKQEGSYAYMIFDEQTYGVSPRLRAGILKKRGASAPDIQTLAASLSLPLLPETLDTYNKQALSRGRRPLLPPFYALNVRPRIHMTKGGLRTDGQSRLLDADNKPVPHFYAAGEVADMPFAALLGSFVFGIDAGRNAASSLGD